MVKRLELDSTRMSKLTDPQSSVSDLASLLLALKTLKEIDILDPFDKPPYRERSRRIRRWHYPDELFEALKASELRLRSWRWNQSYCARGPVWMHQIHSTEAFQTVRELSLTKFHTQELRKPDDESPAVEELLGSTLTALPNLKSLTFETCTVLNNRLLPLLPGDLVNLSIVNCRDITADALQAYLKANGQNLQELILNHNQSLDLSFLVDLKHDCPRLEVLRMDMHYYNTLSTSSDNEPLYDDLLSEGEVPSWPSSLRTIDLEFLRKWSSTAAVAFFNSLIDSAENLPWLRELVITAIVDIDWRQRAEFRRKWTARFQKVFASNFDDPNPNLMSLRAFREWKASLTDPAAQKNDSLAESQAEHAKTARGKDEDSDSDAPLLPTNKKGASESWGSKRLRSRANTTANYDDETSSNESSEETSVDPEDLFVQGLCHTVVFKIDNSRPQEQIYDEEDFLDDEMSGDEDWNGNDDNIGNEDYAW